MGYDDIGFDAFDDTGINEAYDLMINVDWVVLDVLQVLNIMVDLMDAIVAKKGCKTGCN